MENIETTITNTVAYLGQNGIQVIFSIVTFFIAIKGIKYLLKYLSNFLLLKKIDPPFANTIVLITKYVLYILLLFILATFLGLDTSALLTLFIIVAIVLVVAMQTTLANIGGGVMLLVIKPFNEGNFVEINGKEGYVKEVGLYHTLLTQRDNSVVYVPNAEVLNTDIVNMDSKRQRRVDIDIYVNNNSDILLLRKIAFESIKGDRRILTNHRKPTVIVREIEPFGIKVRTRLWVKKHDYWDVLYDYNEKLLNEYKKANVKFPDVNIAYTPKN